MEKQKIERKKSLVIQTKSPSIRTGLKVSGWTYMQNMTLRANVQVHHLQNVVEITIFLLRTCVLQVVAVITWLQCRIEFLRHIPLTIHHRQADRQIRFICECLRETPSGRTCLEVLAVTSFQTKIGKIFFPPKRLTFCGPFYGMWSVGTRFRHQRQPQVL